MFVLYMDGQGDSTICNIFKLVFTFCHKFYKYNCLPWKMLNHAGEINFLYNSWKYHNSHVKINFASNIKTLNILYLYCHSSCDNYITRGFFLSHFDDLHISSPLTRCKQHQGLIEHWSRNIDFTYRQRTNIGA